MRTILSRALAELNARQSVMLVTIVAEQGSAPRGPGSQMLVGADGQLTGTIGGGQVERQSELLALSLLKERCSQMQHFALTQAGADSLGMACGGDVTVLFQFISPEDTLWQSVLETALAQLTAAQPGWLILRTDGSAPALLDGEGMALLGSSGTAPLSKRCILTETDFSLPLPIGERAVIFGAGQPKFRSMNAKPGRWSLCCAAWSSVRWCMMTAPLWPIPQPSPMPSRWCAASFGTSPAHCPCPRRIMWW